MANLLSTTVTGNITLQNTSKINFGSNIYVGMESGNDADLTLKSYDDLYMRSNWIRIWNTSNAEYARIAINNSWINATLNVNSGNDAVAGYGLHVGGSSKFNGYLLINQNWAGGDYGAEQLTIRGTYPSIALRSTQHNSKWLIHNDDTLSFYYGGPVDDNSWARKFFIPTDGDIWMSWAGDYLSNLLGAKQNASTAITTSNIGSQSVSYATSAGNSNTTSQNVFSNLKGNFPSGAGGGHYFAQNHYSMGLDSGNGGWDSPHYRDLIIGYHTGIRIGGAYSGIRFYNNSPTTDANNDGNGDVGEELLMTIGGYVGTANGTDVVVNNNLFANASMRAPIFYDSNDTTYYLDPNAQTSLKVAGNLYIGQAYSWSSIYMGDTDEGSREIHCNSNRIGFLTQGGSWGSWCGDGGDWFSDGYIQSFSSMYSPIYYDGNDSNYYGDFAGLSRMSEIGVTNHYVYNYDSIQSGRIDSTWGNVGKYVATRSGAGDYPSFSFEHTNGNHSWGIVARYHIGAGSGSDRPSIQFSNGLTNTRWNIGYNNPDDNFRISQNMGYRTDGSGTSDGWGTERFLLDTAGNIYVGGLLQSSSSLRAPIFYDSDDTNYYLNPTSTGSSLVVAGYTKSKFTYRNNASAGLPGQDNPVKTATGVLATLSGNGGGNEYIIIKTRVPQDSTQMGGFTIDLFADYYSTNAKTTISLGGYWNPESNGGFLGWEYNTTNPNVRPGIFVMRDVTDGSTCFAIQISKAYPVIVARDLYLGYNSSDIEGWLDWSIFGADDLGGYTNNDTVICRGAMPINAWFGNSYIGENGTYYGTIFYDSNDTNYYVDPNGESRLYKVNDNGGDTYGTKYFYSNVGSSTYIGAGNAPTLQAYSNDAGPAFMTFHRGGQYAVNFGLDPDNVLRVGGWSASSNRMQLDMSGNVTFAGDVTAYSDARVKENVHTIENALDKTLQLRGVTYNRTDSEDKSTKVGVIAQEVLEVVPEVVNQDASGMYNVSYGNLTAVLIEAIKEQQKQIDELKEIINGLTK